MDEFISKARELATKLAKNRLSNLENDLAKATRLLTSEQKLDIVMQLVNEQRVRSAAAIAVRGQLGVREQYVLLQLILELGKSNLIRVMVSDLFVHRLSNKLIVRSLKNAEKKLPKSVNFAAYYFLGGGNLSPALREEVRSIYERTKQLSRLE